jgi:hypothetical protein
MKPPLIRAPFSAVLVLLACLALAGFLTGCGGGTDDADDLLDDRTPPPAPQCVPEIPLVPCRAHSI